MEIFRTSRIKFTELYKDSMNYISKTYDNVGQYFSVASPMGQLLNITLRFGRMIMFYIEDSITELNIFTATRPNSVKGLSTLTGHNPSRAMSARGTLTLAYNGETLEDFSNVVTIPNYTKLTSVVNGLSYTIIMSGEETKLNLTSITDSVNLNVVQGTIEYQQGTGNGEALQSFNFAVEKGAGVDNYYVNVYVDGKKWTAEKSILDMTFDSESCLVKSGQTNGIDVFFGNGYNGRAPELGSVILVEYLITDGAQGNIFSMEVNLKNQWVFKSPGYSINGEEVDLNKIINITIKNQILFGAEEEPLYLTRLLAPNTSRSFVLANTTNYIYFLRKLNIFTIIDAIPGFATYEDQYALDKYNQTKTTYEKLDNSYKTIIATYGVDSKEATDLKPQLDEAGNLVFIAKTQLDEQKKDDNTIYLFLIPDVNKRIAQGLNYYNAPIEAFSLSEKEKLGIYNLIEESGQRVLTVDNVILDIQYPKFVLNMSLIIWEGYEYETVRETIIAATSAYFLKNTRRDRLPVSDLIKVIEDVDGVDSVNVWFDADKDNINIYKTHYGIDEFGDLILERKIVDAWNNSVAVKDVYAMIRGGFTSSNGVYYEEGTSKDKLSTVNIQVRGFTSKDLNTKHNQAILNNI